VKPLLRKLFGKKKEEQIIPSEINDIPTEPNYDTIKLEIDQIEVDHSSMQIGFGRSVGKVRDHNEDAFYTITTNIAVNDEFIPSGLYIVADGMGGHKNGEVASELAIRIFASQIMEKILLPLTAPDAKQPENSIQEIMQESAQKAHKMIMKEVPGSGTTLTAALIIDNKMTIAHAGDSRAYLISPKDEIKALTRDHSLVERMIELGQLTREEAAVHPQRNVLYRALGQSEQFSVDVNTTTLPAIGHILLCSDGLWGLVPEKQIVTTINQSINPKEACSALIKAANEAGGTDNITAVLIQLPYVG
jgi:PPM family protein phosphatase